MRAVLRPIVGLGSILLGLGLAEVIVRVFIPQSLAVPWQDEINGITGPRPNVRGRHALLSGLAACEVAGEIAP